MSEKPSENFAVQSQRERWIKYGGNVVLGCIVAILLAVAVIYAAERKPYRFDATASGMYSLKPQTLKILKDVNSPIRLVSLYTHSKPPTSPDQDPSQAPLVAPDEAAQTVNDLLDEYSNANKKITVETIDPVTSPTKVDDLIEEVESKYGGEITKYAQFVKSFPDTIKQITAIADPEVTAVKALPLTQATDQDVLQTLQYAFVTVEAFPKNLGDLQDALQRLRQKPPDYKGAADAITEGMTNLSSLLDAVITNFGVLQKRGGLPPEVDKYMTDSLPHYQQLKKIVDDTLKQGKGLGELKLDTLRSALRERNTILVMGDKEWRTINFDSVWQPAARTANAPTSDAPPHARFAGEQQVTSAILSLGSGGIKPKVAIVRAGGQPLAQAMGFMGGGDAPLSMAADRLALYNYDVVEKDLTGQFSQQSGMPEPSDDDIKNATWVVFAFKGQASQMGPPPSIGPQVAEHLRNGGSAVILTASHQDGMDEALAEWGVQVRTDATVVHDTISAGGGDTSDIVEQVLRMQYVFDLHDYGDSPLTKPLDSLEGLFADIAPVIIKPTKGYTATPILPVPTAPDSPRSWGSMTFDRTQPNAVAIFDPNADVTGQLYAGTTVQKDTGGRLVVLAAGFFPDNQFLSLTSQQIDPNAPPVLRFPGNGELFTNAVFWASHQDTLIDISPASLDIGRIRDISPGALTFWRVGVLLLGLPGLVLVTGIGVYLKRKD